MQCVIDWVLPFFIFHQCWIIAIAVTLIAIMISSSQIRWHCMFYIRYSDYRRWLVVYLITVIDCLTINHSWLRTSCNFNSWTLHKRQYKNISKLSRNTTFISILVPPKSSLLKLIIGRSCCFLTKINDTDFVLVF